MRAEASLRNAPPAGHYVEEVERNTNVDGAYYPGVWVMGDLSDDDRGHGMEIVVKYAGHSGKPPWVKPKPFLWGSTRFGKAGNIYVLAASAAFTRSDVIGYWRSRTPVASDQMAQGDGRDRGNKCALNRHEIKGL